MRHTLYCEYNFLIDFFKNKPQSDSKDFLLEDQKVEIWTKYCGLFFSESCICVNISKDDFYKDISHPFIKMLIKKKGEGEVKIKYDNKYPKDFGVVSDKHAIFFCCDAEACNRWEEDYGMLFFSNNNLFDKAAHLFHQDSNFCTINEKTTDYWQSLKKYRHPCNFIVIIDNFIFKKERVCNENLTSLFDALLPDKIKKTFSIIIRTRKPTIQDVNWEDWKEIIQCADWKDKVTTYFTDIICKKRKKENFPFRIIFEEIKYSVHDRNLITNYYWLSSGYGFVLSDNEKQKGTDIHVHHLPELKVLERINDFKGVTVF